MNPSTSSSPLPGSFRNPVKELLRAGQPAVGAVISTNSVELASQMANTGFDFLWIEMEHCPVTLEGLRNIVLATRGLRAVPLVRPPVNEVWMAKRVLDAGALGVIFPFTNSADLARQAVSACRYPPHGKRGSGATLAQARWNEVGNYYDWADDQMLVVTMIEDVEAVANIDAIAATPGVDVLFVGPSDLSFSLGLRGRQDEPKLNEAIQTVRTAAQRHGKFLGRPATTRASLEKFIEQGFQLFHSTTEVEMMVAGAREFLGPRFRPAAGGGPAGI